MQYNTTSIQQHQAGALLNRHFRLTKKNILGDGVKLCRRVKAHNTSNPHMALIAVHEHPNGKITSNMHDVGLCGNAHLCSYCSSVKAAHLRNWINELLLHAVKRAGLVLGLLTLTASHKRDCDWTEFNKNFFLALTDFGKTMRREFDAISSKGRVRTFETPIGSNGLHGHIHDLFTYMLGVDMKALKQVALKKWKAALKKYGLHCSKRGVDIMEHGTFDPNYIAKEVAAHDTKKNSKSDLKTMFQLLDESARGNKQAGDDWIRAAKAIQGRDRWNVGQLANKLNIECPSDWKRSQGAAKAERIEPANVITYPQTQHMMATQPGSKRPGLAMILRTARQRLDNSINTVKIVDALCKDYTKQMLFNIPAQIAEALKQADIEHEKAKANIERLLTTCLINMEVAGNLKALGEIEHTLLKKERIAAINSRADSIKIAGLHLTPGADLVFM